MKKIRVADLIKPGDDFFTLPFEYDAESSNLNGRSEGRNESPGNSNLNGRSRGVLWGMTLCKAGSMRFRWNETNPNRQNIFSKILPDTDHQIVPVQLDHTKIVYDVNSADKTKNQIGDGIITKNPLLIPTITIADCMPIFLYDPVTKVFGIVHSGWKGTGIVQEAIKLAEKNYGSKAENFKVVLGPHIHDCCYIVNKERSDYFAQNFTADCIQPLELDSLSKDENEGKKLPSFVWNNGNGPLFRLSLEKANLSVLKNCGVKDENITVCTDCTACTPDGIFGSNRRETASKGKDNFTVMAGFIIS